jgi:hypothetical protein
MANTALDTIDIPTNSFRNWIEKTNEAITVLRNQAVTVANTADGDVVTGNGFVFGTLGANTITATTLRGGSANSSSNLAIITNTNINAAYVNVVANTLIYSNSTVAAAVFGGNNVATNTTFNSTFLNMNSNLAIIGSAHNIGGNVNFDTGTLFVDAVNNRIGINDMAPAKALTINGAGSFSGDLTYQGITISGNSVATSGTGQATIDEFDSTVYRTAKYTISITSGTSDYQSSEILVMHDGSSSYLTEYAVLRSGSNLGTFVADVSGGNVRLLFTPTVASSTIKLSRMLMVV